MNNMKHYMKLHVRPIIGLALMLTHLAGCKTPHASTPKVVNGEPAAKYGIYPWMVSLQEDNKSFCGAALIAPTLILTAKHCFRVDGIMKYENVEAKIGKVFLSRNEPGEETFRIVKVITPSTWVGLGDIAIGVLSGASAKKPIRINESATFPVKGSRVEAIGWGRWIGATRPETDELYLTGTTFQQVTGCHPDQICLQFEDGGTCFGDSGGPLFAREGDEPVLIGVVNGGDNTMCVPPSRNEYASTATYKTWIKGEIEKAN